MATEHHDAHDKESQGLDTAKSEYLFEISHGEELTIYEGFYRRSSVSPLVQNYHLDTLFLGLAFSIRDVHGYFEIGVEVKP